MYKTYTVGGKWYLFIRTRITKVQLKKTSIIISQCILCIKRNEYTDFFAILHVPLSCDKFSAIYSRNRVQAIVKIGRLSPQCGTLTIFVYKRKQRILILRSFYYLQNKSILYKYKSVKESFKISFLSLLNVRGWRDSSSIWRCPTVLRPGIPVPAPLSSLQSAIYKSLRTKYKIHSLNYEE